MRIVVNTRLLLKDRLEGIGWFEYETLKRLTTQHPECEFIFLFDRQYDKEFIFSDNIIPLIVYPPTRHPVLQYIWFEYSIPGVIKRMNPDLFLSPDGYLSLRSKVKSLAVMHDLNFEHNPENLPYTVRKYYRHFFPKFARHAARIVTVSEFSKQDIAKQYNVSADKIDVVYNGANESYKPVDRQTRKATMEKYTNGTPYFIFIGSLHPRKNLTGLFRAFDMFRLSGGNTKLLIVGEKRWWTDDIKNVYNKMQHRDDVILTGWVSTGELNKIIGSAVAMVYPSFFEGFGIPIVEAFYCGTPVITSNQTSMPEVAGDAALLVDPHSPESIAEAMKQIAADEALRSSLIQKGNARKELFTWQKTADRLWEAIIKTLK